jgi:hypothetical protein
MRVAGVRDRVGADRVVGEPLEQLARLRTRDVDRAEHRGLVQQVDVEAPAVGPVAQARLHPVRAARGRGDRVRAVGVRAEQAVVHRVPGLVEHDEVARAAGFEVLDVAREHAVDERPRVAPGDEELAERPHVHQAHALAHGAVVLAPVAVPVRPDPRSRAVEVRAHREVPLVQRGPLRAGLVHPGREDLERTVRRRPSNSRAPVTQHVRRGEQANAATARLARPHRRVVWQDLRCQPSAPRRAGRRSAVLADHTVPQRGGSPRRPALTDSRGRRGALPASSSEHRATTSRRRQQLLDVMQERARGMAESRRVAPDPLAGHQPDDDGARPSGPRQRR